MGPTMTCKQFKSFMRRVSYACIFPTLIELLEPLHKLLEKNAPFKYGKKQRFKE